jgi:Fe-S-cluster-containing hydrogenase component 2
MLRVRSDLCRGCRICIESCPQQAISLVSGTAYIIQERCNQCRRCLEACPQGAIIEVAPVSADKLKIAVAGLKDKTEDIMARIEKLREKQRRI